MSEPILLVEKRDGIATLTLNRPKALNALSRALVAEITRAFAELQADTSVDVAILTGAGRAFCAGVDLKELSSAGAAPQVPGDGPDSAVRLIDAIAGFDRPLIGAIPGVDGLFVCAGHGAWGISTGPASSRLVVDAMLGRPVVIPTAFDPGRFGPIPV